ncbi:DUF2177 family protein [Hansschlegelia quercus]|uniref:DUF2177 family protein n=1 Tax=Hansschlegelia quercus TaxID=2528245 RepID=A0A4Q9GHE7_9HYPH|nr:DUF2177 family protein [Hansschlegelia quercus]TBN48013.1 DUF2177 family protein [Hansschlegelia quercus]
MRILIAYVATALVFLAGDMIWLGYVARDFYRNQMGELMAPNVSLTAAVAFYLIYIVGVVYFAVLPALNAGSWTTALVSGLMLGLIAYATYDLTNLATTRDWPAALAFADLAWGATLTAVASTAGFFITRALTSN